ncbi:hypothetical protein [Novosphingobium sp. PhB165]|uniref:hypothetical protein n=1 Tax=Novosphingobium sp. PhB165 TaxID=2485105 RepID=UPI0014049BB6|nr:hypothetical protein [Novosphingobium sp. PhB165]
MNRILEGARNRQLKCMLGETGRFGKTVLQFVRRIGATAFDCLAAAIPLPNFIGGQSG